MWSLLRSVDATLLCDCAAKQICKLVPSLVPYGQNDPWRPASFSGLSVSTFCIQAGFLCCSRTNPDLVTTFCILHGCFVDLLFLWKDRWCLIRRPHPANPLLISEQNIAITITSLLSIVSGLERRMHASRNTNRLKRMARLGISSALPAMRVEDGVLTTRSVPILLTVLKKSALPWPHTWHVVLFPATPAFQTDRFYYTSNTVLLTFCRFQADSIALLVSRANPFIRVGSLKTPTPGEFQSLNSTRRETEFGMQ